MNVKLIYLYIKEINRPFNGMEFTFTNDFKITFNPEKVEIKIEKNSENIQNFWGYDISSVDILIGRNGSGKSTILDLLAQNKLNRNYIFNGDSEWFAIYHVVDDIYVVEGSNHIIAPINTITDKLDREYSLVCSYDLEKKKFKYPEFIQEFTLGNVDPNVTIDNTLVYIYDTASLPAKSWIKNSNRRFEDSSSFSFKRHFIEYPSFSSIYLFITREYDQLEKELFSAQGVVCKVSSNILYDKLDMQESRKLNLYNDGNSLSSRLENNRLVGNGNHSNIFGKKYYTTLSIKEQCIITMLENIIMNLWMERVAKKEEDKKKKKKKQANDDWIETIAKRIEESSISLNEDFRVIKNYLYNIINELYIACNVKYPRFELSQNFVSSVKKFVESLLTLNSDFFINNNLLRIPISNVHDRRIEELLNIYDSYVADDDYMFSDLKTLFSIEYSNLSTGELQFLDRFSSLYKTIKSISNHNVKSVILCLDEPEGSFHPEWARKYISYLVKFLNIINESKEIKYQIIIATHSPFIVSDIPKYHINCMQFSETEDKIINRSVSKAHFGFASNLYDIVGDDFFVKASIGQFALEKLNELLKRIMELQESNIAMSINEIKQTIELVGDQVIKNKLSYLLEEKEKEYGLLPKIDEKDKRILELEMEIAMLRENNYDKN